MQEAADGRREPRFVFHHDLARDLGLGRVTPLHFIDEIAYRRGSR